MTTLGDLGKIVADEIKLVRIEAEEVKVQTEEKIEIIDTQLSGTIETDLSDHENKLRNHEGKIKSLFRSFLHEQQKQNEISNDVNTWISTIEAQIITIEAKQQKFDNITTGLFNYFSKILESDSGNSDLSQLVATLSENN